MKNFPPLRVISLRLLFSVSVMRARLSLAVISLFCSMISIIYIVYGAKRGCAYHLNPTANVNKFII